MRTSAFAGAVVMLLAACGPDLPSTETTGTETSTEGDGDGDPDGDGDGEGDLTGDGDGDGLESWCPVCIEPVDSSACQVKDHGDIDERVHFAQFAENWQDSIDEMCTVTAVSPTQIDLDCEVHDSQITLELANPWSPNLVVDELVHVRAEGLRGEWGWENDWRIEHEDESLAIAGSQDFNDLDSVGFGLLEATAIHELCAPLGCEHPHYVYQDFGLHLVHGDDEATLFAGNHTTLGDLEIWTPDVRHLACDNGYDAIAGKVAVFVSAL